MLYNSKYTTKKLSSFVGLKAQFGIGNIY